MSGFSDDFLAAFPTPASDKLMQTLAQSDSIEMAIETRYLSSVALIHSIPAAIAYAQSIISNLEPDPSLGAVAIDSLVAVANVVLDSGTDARMRSREVTDLLFQVAAASPQTLQQARAHAAVIHARAEDRMLASWRIKEYRASQGPSDEAFWWWNDVIRQDLLAAYAQLLLGVEQEIALRAEVRPVGVSNGDRLVQEVHRLAWKWLMGFHAEPYPDDLEEAISNAALLKPDETFGTLVYALAIVPRITGFNEGLAYRGGSLLAQAEELLWLANPPRGPLLSQLALAAASLSDDALAGRCIDAAVDVTPSHALPSEVLLDFAANLLDAQALIQSRVAASQADAVPATANATLSGRPRSDTVGEPFPDALIETLEKGNVLLVAGPEIPAARHALGRTELLRLLVERTDLSISDAARQQVLASLAVGNLDPVARLLHARNDGIESQVARIYAVSPPIPAYDALAQIPFTGVINMSWDSSLLGAFEPRSPVVIGGNSEQVLSAVKSQEFAFTWFAGDPDREPIAISRAEIRSRLAANETLSRFLTGRAQSSSLLFIGVHAPDIIDFFEALQASGTVTSPTMMTSQPCFAICATDELWELNRPQLHDDFGVDLIGYDPSDPDALPDIVQRLLNAYRPAVSGNGTTAQPLSPRQVLSRVTLTNIAAFEQLELELGEAWNVLLGINGCGKTTVLRAVALGLCGDHASAQEAGEGLLRTGCDKGLIELQVGSSRFRTELQRVTGTVRVRTSSLSPVEEGSWAVLGFPALRGTSLTAPSGISSPQAPEPRVEDLLPLLRNQADARLDDIKQWIVNVEARTHQQEDARARQLLDRFFAVLGDLIPGVMLEFDSVDQASWEVWVRTDDGVVSIDQLSQGMNSIIAWVGTLLQRMYDIYADSDEPAAESAFVLIDELDAHLHPAWQRLLPSLTREHFPRVQFLATSHSPLVAGSLRRGELFVAERTPVADSDGTEHLVATVTAADMDPEGLRADQVLTSPLFGLMTSRSPGFGTKVDRYGQLMTAASRTSEEEAEMQSLKSVISASYSDGETEAERDAEAGQEPDLEETLANIEPTEQNIAMLHRLADTLGTAGELDDP